jgi:hypothetical protein
MKIMPNTTTKRNQRIVANLRRVQGHVAAIERDRAPFVSWESWCCRRSKNGRNNMATLITGCTQPFQCTNSDPVEALPFGELTEYFHIDPTMSFPIRPAS